MCWQATQTYPCEALTPRHARRFVAQQFTAALGSSAEVVEIRDVAEIVTSELVTNAYRASGRRARLSVAFHRSLVRLAVSDDAPGTPHKMHPEPTDEKGRGLQIVASLARDWGVAETRDGKQVWAELPLPVPVTTSLHCYHSADTTQATSGTD